MYVIPILLVNGAFEKELSVRALAKQSRLYRGLLRHFVSRNDGLHYAQSDNRIGIR